MLDANITCGGPSLGIPRAAATRAGMTLSLEPSTLRTTRYRKPRFSGSVEAREARTKGRGACRLASFLLRWPQFGIVGRIMARLRKAGRIWRKPEARASAERVLIEARDGFFTIDPSAIFERAAPLEIELGAGRGDFIVARAAEFPERNFIAVELSGVVSRMLAVRCGSAGLANLRVARMDARPLVGLMLPPRSVSAYHIYFPDPWPKERHQKHRLFTPQLAAGLARTLAIDGILCVATDVAEYAAEIFPMLEAAGFSRLDERAPGAEATAFARKFIALGKPVLAATLRPPGLGAAGE